MTILQFISARRFGGAERYFIRLIEYLREAGHRVLIVVVRDSPLHVELTARNFEVFAWPPPSRHNPKMLWDLYRLVKREKVDVINTHLTRASLVGTLIGKLTGVPVVVRIPAAGDRFPHEAPHFIAVAEGVKSYLLEEGVDARKITVLYNGIDLKKYSTRTPQLEAKARLGFSEHDWLIGVIANLRERKGHCYLFEAVSGMKDHGPIPHILCVGEGEDDMVQNLRDLSKSLGIEQYVHFLGQRSDIPEILSALDVFVLPSLKEGLSNAVMEAMAMECPVIVTDVGGQSDVVRHGETGMLVPAADPEALREAILQIRSNTEAARALGSNARRFLSENFEQSRCLQKVEEFLKHC